MELVLRCIIKRVTGITTRACKLFGIRSDCCV